ncbi:MAG: glycosyl transferase family 2 [Desulfobacterium sp. 4572_20]|nr:MAG: glycosyl transferase family 2 [Desulfobacterium sp. 4572_20]
MINGKRILVVLPAYNAEETLERTYKEIPLDVVDEVLLVDDYSVDSTVSTPKLITAMASMIAFNVYDIVLGSRIIGGGALKGGMPVYKYIANRFLTAVENLLLGSKLSEFHTGYRAFSRAVLENLPFQANSDNFVFDNEMLAQIIFFGYRIGEVSCPTKYFKEASSINFKDSAIYGWGVLKTSIKFRTQRLGFANFRIFTQKKHAVHQTYYQSIK